MKKEYPNYKQIGVQFIEDGLSSKDKRIFQEFLNYAGVTASKRKIEQYRLYLLQFRDIVETPFDKITKSKAEEFWSLVNHDLSREIHTKNQIRMIVKRFLKWYYKDLDMIENLKTQKHLVNSKKFNKSSLIKPEEIELLLRTANNFRDKALITLLYESAARPEEVRKLTFDKIDFMNKTIKLYSNKTKSAREVPVNNSISRLEEWKQDYFFPNVTNKDYVFPSHVDRDEPLSESFFTQLIKRLCKKAKIRNLTPYDFRRTRLTELYVNEKVPDLIHRKFAGHTPDSKMTAVYVKMDERDMQETIKGIYDLKKLPAEKKCELEKEIENLKEQLGHQFFYNKTFIDFYSGKIDQKEFQKRMKKLYEKTKNKGITEFKTGLE